MTLTQIHTQLYPQFQKAFDKIITDKNIFNTTQTGNSQVVDFDYLMQVSSVYSSKIEGNSLDINSYFNQTEFDTKTKNKEVVEITDLFIAYQFAKDNVLNEKKFLKAHKISTKSFLDSFQSGKYRQSPVGVFGNTGLIYMATEPEKVEQEIKVLFAEIQELLKLKLTDCEALFYAGLLHIKIAQIHPFVDGNGRMARLVEKWFLSNFVGEQIWNLQPEKYIFENKKDYYTKINLGSDYYSLDYTKAIGFIELVIKSYLL
jgi:Fic family protein